MLGMVRFFWNLEVTSRDTSSNKVTSSNPLQTVPAIGDQVFSYGSLWGHSHSSHCTRYKASSHAYVWMAGPPPLSSPTLPTSYTQWGTSASKGIYTKRSETVKIPKSRTLWHLKRMVHQFQHKSQTFLQQKCIYTYTYLFDDKSGLSRESVKDWNSWLIPSHEDAPCHNDKVTYKYLLSPFCSWDLKCIACPMMQYRNLS